MIVESLSPEAQLPAGNGNFLGLVGNLLRPNGLWNIRPVWSEFRKAGGWDSFPQVVKGTDERSEGT